MRASAKHARNRRTEGYRMRYLSDQKAALLDSTLMVPDDEYLIMTDEEMSLCQSFQMYDL